jgi:hypothetical protein
MISRIYRIFKNSTEKINNPILKEQNVNRHFSKKSWSSACLSCVKLWFCSQHPQKVANKYMKGFSIALIIRMIQIKTAVRYHLTPLRMAILKKTKDKCGEDVEKREPLHTIGIT